MSEAFCQQAGFERVIKKVVNNTIINDIITKKTFSISLNLYVTPGTFQNKDIVVKTIKKKVLFIIYYFPDVRNVATSSKDGRLFWEFGL